MSTGSRALPLLCKTTRFLPADVTRLVRECLRVHMGARCPAWFDDLLWQHLPRLEGGHLKCRTLVTLASRNIDPAICPQHWRCFGKSSSDEEETDDEGVRVTLELEVSNCKWIGYLWRLECVRGGTQGADVVTGNSTDSLTKVLDKLRGHFDCRRAGPSATMEVPSSLKDWHSFVGLWLLGPSAPKQATLEKWLRRRPRALPQETQ